MGTQLGALLDTPAIGNHHRQGHATVLGAPPARHPVTAALLFGRTIGKKRHQGLARQRQVGILQLGKTEVTTLGNSARGMRIDVTAQRRRRTAITGLGIAVEITQQAIHPRLAIGIARNLFGVLIGGQQVQRLDRRHAVTLAHQPATGLPAECIQAQVTGIGRHHVQRPAGVPLGLGLEILRLHGRAIQPHTPGIGHVHHQPEAGHAQAIQRLQQLIDLRQRRLLAALHQLMGQTKHRRLRLRTMLNRTVTRLPGSERRLLLGMCGQFGKAGQYLLHGR